MHYKRIELKVTNQGIHERRFFQGLDFQAHSVIQRSEKHFDTEDLPDTEAKYCLLSTNRYQL